MYKFLERYKLPKVTWEDIDALSGPIANKEITLIN